MKSQIKKENFILLEEKVKALYKANLNSQLTDFPPEVRNLFYTTGNRSEFEKLYFGRRDFLSSCAVLALFDKKYIPQLEKILLAVCDEYSWALPSHTDGTCQGDKTTIDLFVAETSFTLSEIYTIFYDELSEIVKNRVREEVKKRLTDNYINNEYWWESCKMNWASVCGSFTGGTLLYLFPEEFQRQRDRILKTLQCYIDGFPQDGTCLEGASYWLYGFTSYVYFADLLYKKTGGKTDLLKDEKVQNIAGFMERVFIKDNTCVSFSDADISVKADMGLQHYLAEKMPRKVSLLRKDNMSLWGGNTKWLCFLRTLMWVDSNKKPNSKVKDYYSASSGQLIINRDNYSFAIKGGNNAEPHNHNDLGSFIFSTEKGQILCDLGAGRYTKDYFDENKRYGIFCNSSLSHNVPIINGKPQESGIKYSAELTYKDNVARTDLSKAYSEKALKLLIRTAEINNTSVVITDEYELSEQIPVTERFVSLKKPTIRENRIIIEDTEIMFSTEKASVHINEEYHIPHGYDEDKIKVYCIDFILKDNINKISFEIKVR